MNKPQRNYRNVQYLSKRQRTLTNKDTLYLKFLFAFETKYDHVYKLTIFYEYVICKVEAHTRMGKARSVATRGVKASVLMNVQGKYNH